ncbi:plastocyanin/azurin family copper-binding protein [Halomicroarcula sp. GCM10025709]|uniref:cupredoxin domain-containing protein n=1 Tax=Haloarcula TaxID=2237 RepID=UPI0024C42AB1|nr:plastocyanin/azurin family copper-binding protein [Halomicroarcula sp. YJ-61-S]
MQRRTLLKVVGAAAVGLAGCSESGSTATETPTPTPTVGPSETLVEMTDSLKFVPETVEISVGDTVVWETVGSVAHSVTAYEDDLPAGADYFASGEFDSESAARQDYPVGSVGPDETYTHTFETAGEYPYFCIPHESGMVGTVVVE